MSAKGKSVSRSQPSPSSEIDFYEILVQALSAKKGLILNTNGPDILLRKLRAMISANEEFKSLRAIPSRTNPESQVWVLNKGE